MRRARPPRQEGHLDRRGFIRFEQYAGLYVLHCHNLEHEDAGMMLNLEVS